MAHTLLPDAEDARRTDRGRAAGAPTGRPRSGGLLAIVARWGFLAATLAGLAAAVWAFGRTGFTDVLAVSRRIGAGGLLLYVMWSIGVFTLLGGAWLAAAQGTPVARLGRFTWARIVREAVADLLPFSQIGGIVFGTRTLIGIGIPSARINASLIVDMTTEMAAQFAFTLLGLTLMAMLVTTGRADSLMPIILGGAATLAIAMLLVFAGQRVALALAGRIAQHLLPGSSDTMREIDAELVAIYARRRRVGLAFLLNLSAWVATALGSALLLAMMGVHVSVWAVLSLESLIYMLRSAAFMIPGAIGVQEAGYTLAGPLFGIPPDIALALSLAKRARDVGIGIPTLIIWQFREARALIARPRTVNPPPPDAV